jgi:demethylmenaquinone methyltransferase/2-methoxy-6-polyprenyl-1,4-benzoquinol methylase
VKKIAVRTLKYHRNDFGRFRKHAFEDNSFDAITVAFGIRNFETLERIDGNNEVLKPNGVL